MLLLAGISSFSLISPAIAQETATAAMPPVAQAQSEGVDERTIIVTGTRRSERTVADSPVPIDVIGAKAINRTGQTETNKILNQLVPSFNLPQPSIADGSDALRLRIGVRVAGDCAERRQAARESSTSC